MNSPGFRPATCTVRSARLGVELKALMNSIQAESLDEHRGQIISLNY